MIQEGAGMDWEFSLPVRIVFGEGKVRAGLGEILEREGLSKGLLVTDPVLIQNGLADQVVEASKGRITGVYQDLVSNPTVQNVDKCANIIKECGYSFLVCLGGGSSLDCGKAASSLCKTDDSIREYMYGRKTFGPEHLPLIAIPTTSGTGSEVTMVAVITDQDSNKKLPVATPNFYPLAAILDPVLTLTVPPGVTASCGIDVLSQALEGYWSRNHQPICDACAVRASSLVFRYLERACENGSDLKARAAMCEASLLAGIAFAAPKTSGPHVCSYPLTSIYHVPHGEACGLTLDSFLRLNAEAEGGRLHDLARMIGKEDAYTMADDIGALKKKVGLRCRLRDAGVTEGEIGHLVSECHHPNMALNPVEITDEYLEKMFRELL